MTTNRQVVQDVAKILRDAGIIVGRFDAAKAIVAAGYLHAAAVWDEGHAAGVWNSSTAMTADRERRNPYHAHAETCDMGDDCSCELATNEGV